MSKARSTQRADGEATRRRILEAAGALIAMHGFAQTTNKMVAAEAGADMASINYHFGNRNGLYQATLIEAHRRIIDRADIERIATAAIPARDKLRGLIAFFLASASGEDRWPVIVLFRELVAPSAHIAALRDVEVAPKLMMVLPMLSEITGIPVGTPDLWLCLPCIGAPCLALLLIGRNLPFGGFALALPRDEQVERLYTFAIGGLEAVGENYRRKGSGETTADLQ